MSYPTSSSSTSHSSSPSPIAIPKGHTKSKSILKHPMRDAASYLTALSQADADARAAAARKNRFADTNSDAGSTHSFMTTSTSTSKSSSSTSIEYDDRNVQNLLSADIAHRYDELDNSPYSSEEQALHQFNFKHSEFGHCADESYRFTSAWKPNTPVINHLDEDPSYYILLTTYFSYLILIVLGHLRDFFGKRFHSHAYKHLMPSNGYAALNSDFDSFYSRRLKARMDDCFSRPITGVPGRSITLLDRASDDNNTTLRLTGTTSRALNISSYNYLGFAQAQGPCADAVEEGIRRYGVSACGARLEAGTTDLHNQVESLVAKFVGTQDAVICSMGFATNSTTLPALVGKGCLVISDELNHASIRFGVRLSGANVRTFKHNDMESLESLLREVISQGQPRTHRPWKKILLVVEGLYSMEGTLVDLPGIMKLKQRYKFYLYVDEAHSIGALGPHGRGVADYFSVNPGSIDILMGTFTKSFGASGGYIAGSKPLISRLRVRSHAGCYTESMSPAVLTQIMASMASIMGVRPPAVGPGIVTTVSEEDDNSNKLTLTINPASSTGPISADTYIHPGPAPASSLPSWLHLPPYTLSGSEGQTRLRRLAFNARYLSRGLNKLGFITYGHSDSPIVPLLLFHPGKMTLFSRLMIARKVPIVVVVVGYPATPLVSGRARFCLSAAHTKQDCDSVLRACNEIGDAIDLKHGIPVKERWTLDEVIARAVELVNMNILPFEYSKTPFEDKTGFKAFSKHLSPQGTHFAPPLLQIKEDSGEIFVLSQTPAILAYIGPKLGLGGSNEYEHATINQLTLTALDLSNEAHDVHHPISNSLYYEDQKPEAKRRAEDFRENRIPKFLTHFETVLQNNSSGVLVGSTISTADLTLFQVLDGLHFAFPRRIGALRKSGEYTHVFQLYDRVKDELKDYFGSKRRREYSMGLYRDYPELDQE
ncbi:hypothetical protein Clacol_001913 [Clathrus columnatus]|uniref:serine C-palmitoyltransferase n=1 Tax=Clathrus columnatus TaxID=1419009 RepID=A0AAV5A4X0_9AGAM|nr:hypothetical protein Clacol_001913 [Clathrus columnatus]